MLRQGVHQNPAFRDGAVAFPQVATLAQRDLVSPQQNRVTKDATHFLRPGLLPDSADRIASFVTRSPIYAPNSRFFWFSPSTDDALLRSPNTFSAACLSSGWFPLPHFGDWIQDGQPCSHGQDSTAP